ncbi:sensor histidine kinase N-terminal domain-containing protein [Chelatococcus sambhunathii]|uniref:histidine kinase n=1 Tax=Chelatococcus sambhunathii TaxID=363953 RepID=A0ABU1DBA1_9HYPH|nr:ATP-binding protein [Chelatococcus sambhunathii]MDR4305386.1 sensor histidine kinase N-terminal domain-containing protein [Chelatococcus sambhunathii]
MRSSLRSRLFSALLLATGAVWLTAALWIDLGARAEVEQVLDNRLQDAAHMVGSLISSGRLPTDGLNRNPAALLPDAGPYMHQLSCQIWSFDDRLLARSGGAPETRFANGGTGFSEQEINGEMWRVYALEDPANGFRVLVGDRLSLREGLVTDLIKGLLWPAVVILPALGAILWVSVGRGLAPLRRIAGDLSRRDGEDMSQIEAASVPREIRPLTTALNGLFAKVEAARRHEREITAFAAHELRTPLAGLKTQAQIALMSEDRDVRGNALRQILRSVDRTGRLVSQLLALARLDSAPPARKEDVEIGAALDEAVEFSRMAGPDVAVEIGSDLRGVIARVPREALDLVLRNLTENAFAHTPPGGTIRWRRGAAETTIELWDEGPGVPETDLPFLTRRFFRGAALSTPGSGLGLTIAEAAAAQCGASLTLANGPRGGLIASVVFEDESSLEVAT